MGTSTTTASTNVQQLTEHKATRSIAQPIFDPQGKNPGTGAAPSIEHVNEKKADFFSLTDCLLANKLLPVRRREQ